MTLSKAAEDALLAIDEGREPATVMTSDQEELFRLRLIELTGGAAFSRTALRLATTDAGKMLAAYIRKRREHQRDDRCYFCVGLNVGGQCVNCEATLARQREAEQQDAVANKLSRPSTAPVQGVPSAGGSVANSERGAAKAARPCPVCKGKKWLPSPRSISGFRSCPECLGLPRVKDSGAWEADECAQPPNKTTPVSIGLSAGAEKRGDGVPTELATASASVGPSGELAEDEFIRLHGEVWTMRVNGKALEIRKRDSTLGSVSYSRADIEHAVRVNPHLGPDSWPRALAYLEGHSRPTGAEALAAMDSLKTQDPIGFGVGMTISVAAEGEDQRRELKARWDAMWQSLGAEPLLRDSTFRALEKAYSEGRHYHTLEHVLWGLRRIDEINEAEPCLALAEVQCAMFFHDAVMSFDGTSGNDELNSAAFAVLKLLAAGTGAFRANRIAELIRATAHTAEPTGHDDRVLVDADLSMLGADPERFDRYEAQVRKEWAAFDDEQFRAGRADVLRRFLAMPRIFHTDYGHAKWEAKARANLERSLAKLTDERPSYIPASADWLWVTDGLGRRVGAWFSQTAADTGSGAYGPYVIMHVPGGLPQHWAPRLDYCWNRTRLGDPGTPSAAAQLRPLYERNTNAGHTAQGDHRDVGPVDGDDPGPAAGAGGQGAVADADADELAPPGPAKVLADPEPVEARITLRLVGVPNWADDTAHVRLPMYHVADFERVKQQRNEALARAERAEAKEASERLRADANEELLAIQGAAGVRERNRAEQATRDLAALRAEKASRWDLLAGGEDGVGKVVWND